MTVGSLEGQEPEVSKLVLLHALQAERGSGKVRSYSQVVQAAATLDDHFAKSENVKELRGRVLQPRSQGKGDIDASLAFP